MLLGQLHKEHRTLVLVCMMYHHYTHKQAITYSMQKHFYQPIMQKHCGVKKLLFTPLPLLQSIPYSSFEYSGIYVCPLYPNNFNQRHRGFKDKAKH